MVKRRITKSIINVVKKPVEVGVCFCKFLILTAILLIISCRFSQLSSFPLNQSKAKIESNKTRKIIKTTKTTFLAVGDIMLSRGVNRAIESKRNPLLPFSELDKLLSSTDFNFGNLESPIAGNDKRIGHGLVFNTHIHDTQGLTKYKFKIVNLANNHALDQGLQGLRFTQKYLESQKIQYVGVGENKTKAWQPKTIESNGIKIGFIGASYSSINDGGARKNGYVARIEDFEYLKAAIEKLKIESDFVIVTMHAGVEYTRKPHRPQIVFAHKAIDVGADLVIGSHPHWIQTFEQYRGKYIFYSLGNFIFDQRKTDTKEGLTLQITVWRNEFSDSTVETGIKQIELIPVIIERLGVPRRANSTETRQILRKIGTQEQILVHQKNN